MKTIFYFGLIFIFAGSFSLSNAVDIKKFSVPDSYVLGEDDNEPLILDCEYEISPNETGLVVKWLLNGINIYQWIPNQKPFSLGPMKKHIDTLYSPSSNKYDQYRAISIKDPQWNMTGNYTCSVQTFQGMSQQTAELKVINPESDFILEVGVDEEGDDLAVTCSIEDIYPEPHLALFLDDNPMSLELKAEKDKKGPFDVFATSKKGLDEISSPTKVTCVLTIPGTDYEKRKEAIFNAPVQEDVEQLEDLENLDENNTEALSNLESTSEQSEDNACGFFPITILSLLPICIAVIFS